MCWQREEAREARCMQAGSSAPTPKLCAVCLVKPWSTLQHPPACCAAVNTQTNTGQNCGQHSKHVGQRCNTHLLEVARGASGDVVGAVDQLLRHTPAQRHRHLVLQVRAAGENKKDGERKTR